MAKVGRPKKSEQRQRTVMVNFRVKPELKEELVKAGKSVRPKPRSLSAEIEWRLTKSETRAARLVAAVDHFGPELFALLHMARQGIRQLEESTSKKWFEDTWLFEQAVKIIVEMMNFVRPEGSVEAPAPPPPMMGGRPPFLDVMSVDEVAEVFAAGVMWRVMRTPLDEWVNDLEPWERAEWNMMIEPGFSADHWLKQKLGALGDRIQYSYFGPLAVTPEQLKRQIALHKEKRTDPEGYKARIERDRKLLQPGAYLLPPSPADDLILGPTKRKKPASDK